mgnify:CR=1 FL=1
MNQITANSFHIKSSWPRIISTTITGWPTHQFNSLTHIKCHITIASIRSSSLSESRSMWECACLGIFKYFCRIECPAEWSHSTCFKFLGKKINRNAVKQIDHSIVTSVSSEEESLIKHIWCYLVLTAAANTALNLTLCVWVCEIFETASFSAQQRAVSSISWHPSPSPSSNLLLTWQ